MKKALVLLIALVFVGGAVRSASAFHLDLDETFSIQTEQAKSQLTAEAKRNDPEKLFDSQITTLKDRGVPLRIVEILEVQKDAVLKKTAAMKIPEGHIPFLPVIPQTVRGFDDLMAMVRYDGKQGYVYFNPALISDAVKTQSEPYYMYDIEDGAATQGKSPNDAEKVLQRQRRLPLTVAETIALAVHTNVLVRRNLWAVGSRRGGDGVAGLWLGGGGPRLGWGWADGSSARGGSASCLSR